jgi:hypothetical protein
MLAWGDTLTEHLAHDILMDQQQARFAHLTPSGPGCFHLSHLVRTHAVLVADGVSPINSGSSPFDAWPSARSSPPPRQTCYSHSGSAPRSERGQRFPELGRRNSRSHHSIGQQRLGGLRGLNALSPWGRRRRRAVLAALEAL